MTLLSRSLVRGTVTVVAVACAIGVAVFAVPLSRYPTGAREAPGPNLLTTAVAGTSDLDTPTVARLSWSATRKVVAHNLPGSVVTSVFARAGARIGCGARVLAVDGVPIQALCGREPLWRPLSAVSRGPDATELAGFLHDLGLLRSTRPSAQDFTRAVDAFQRSVGIPATGVFDPRLVIWIGGPITPSTVLVGVDDSVQPDLQILESGRTLQSATVVPMIKHRGPLLFNVAGQAPTVDVTTAGRVADLTKLGSIVQQVSFAQGTTPNSVAGTIRLRNPIDVVSVPPSAVVSGSTGTCVVVAAGKARHAAKINVVRSFPDSVQVTGGLRGGQQVETHPSPGSKC